MLEYNKDWDEEISKALALGLFTAKLHEDGKIYTLNTESYQVWVMNRDYCSGYIYDFKDGKINQDWRKSLPSLETRIKLHEFADEIEKQLKGNLK